MNDAPVVSPASRQGAPASTFGTAAYGGAGWSQRTATHAEEIGRLWAGGIDSEWRRLKTVLLRRPSVEATGMLAGIETQPAALSYAADRTGGDDRVSRAYASSPARLCPGARKACRRCWALARASTSRRRIGGRPASGRSPDPQ